MFEKLFEDVRKAPEVQPVIPQGDYNAVLMGYELAEVEVNGEPRPVLRLVFSLQGNPGVMLSDGSMPVDGQTVEYTMFLPDERDKEVPAKFSRGSMYDVAVRRLKAFFKSCGVDPAMYATFEEALEACKGAQVVIRVVNVQTEDGTVFDRVQRIVS